LAARTDKGSTGAYPGRLRIVGGQWRGRVLRVVEGEGLRPTPDRVRETLFNWLQAWTPGARCLDLFAGTGALCLEALSRGASRVVMVERAHHVAENLRANVRTLAADDAQVVETDAESFLHGPVEAFDIIFVDPPFAHPELIERCLTLIAQRGWIHPGGWVYIEAHADRGAPVLPAGWELHRSKIAGQVGYHLARVPQTERP
jgi:16S rRNA (guanine966-N2)-methyltransferase